jgi:hypothetical protein
VFLRDLEYSSRLDGRKALENRIVDESRTHRHRAFGAFVRPCREDDDLWIKLEDFFSGEMGVPEIVDRKRFREINEAGPYDDVVPERPLAERRAVDRVVIEHRSFIALREKRETSGNRVEPLFHAGDDPSAVLLLTDRTGDRSDRVHDRVERDRKRNEKDDDSSVAELRDTFFRCPVREEEEIGTQINESLDVEHDCLPDALRFDADVRNTVIEREAADSGDVLRLCGLEEDLVDEQRTRDDFHGFLLDQDLLAPGIVKNEWKRYARPGKRRQWDRACNSE